jgi:hypothetical protein
VWYISVIELVQFITNCFPVLVRVLLGKLSVPVVFSQVVCHVVVVSPSVRAFFDGGGWVVCVTVEGPFEKGVVAFSIGGLCSTVLIIASSLVMIRSKILGLWFGR